MFEYVNGGVLFGLAIVIALSFIGKEKESPLINIFIGVGFMLVIYVAYSESTTAQENKNFFKKGRLLECHSGGGTFNKAQRYRVSIKDGWELQKDSFIKDSLMIPINKCEIF